MIDNNRDRKPKQLWSDLGEGDPVEVIETEDEHAEARFVAAEIARLVEDGWSANELAVFYGPTPSRACSRTCSCASRSRTR